MTTTTWGPLPLTQRYRAKYRRQYGGGRHKWAPLSFAQTDILAAVHAMGPDVTLASLVQAGASLSKTRALQSPWARWLPARLLIMFAYNPAGGFAPNHLAYLMRTGYISSVAPSDTTPERTYTITFMGKLRLSAQLASYTPRQRAKMLFLSLPKGGH